MNIKNPAKFLDKILLILALDFRNGFEIQELQGRLVYDKEYKNNANVIYSEDLLINLREALNFLNSKHLIQLYNPLEDRAKITFEGYFKIKNQSFMKEIRQNSTNQILQRLAWVIPIIISIIALIISSIKY